jgi:hypothetical protein
MVVGRVVYWGRGGEEGSGALEGAATVSAAAAV